jgi:hypothetical protein
MSTTLATDTLTTHTLTTEYMEEGELECVDNVETKDIPKDVPFSLYANLRHHLMKEIHESLQETLTRWKGDLLTQVREEIQDAISVGTAVPRSEFTTLDPTTLKPTTLELTPFEPTTRSDLKGVQERAIEEVEAICEERLRSLRSMMRQLPLEVD